MWPLPASDVGGSGSRAVDRLKSRRPPVDGAALPDDAQRPAAGCPQIDERLLRRSGERRPPSTVEVGDEARLARAPDVLRPRAPDGPRARRRLWAGDVL